MRRQTLLRYVPRRRRSRVVLAAAVLAVVALVAADRVLARVAASRIADRVVCAGGLARRPDVTVHGFPFLWQASAGRYRHIDVTAHDVHHGELRLATVRASLRDAAVDGGAVSVGALSIEGVVPFDALPARIGEHPVTYGASDGLLAISTTAAVGGAQLPLTLLGRPVISDGTLRIEPQEVEVWGVRRPAGNLLDRLGARDGVSRRLPSLPAGLRYDGVAVESGGLALTVSGTNLSIPAAAPRRAAADPVPSSPRPSEPCGAKR